MNTVAVVTGATRNLGLALVEGLAGRLERGDVVYLTGRDPGRVAEAAERIGAARGEGGAAVRGAVLDVSETGAVAHFAAVLGERHGGVDIVFSHHYARVGPDDDPAEVIDHYVAVNNLGTTQVLRAFAPLLRDGGRLLIVASQAGSLRALAPAPSKVGQVAAVRVLARQRRADDLRRGILIAAVSPGLIDTGASRPWLDMTRAQTPARAADALLDLALDRYPDPGCYGELVGFGKVLPWTA
jgi:NAD(P)-dependent dehydrogenase (short-subunit alcohol dehydrogenase family)